MPYWPNNTHYLGKVGEVAFSEATLASVLEPAYSIASCITIEVGNMANDILAWNGA